MMHNFGMEMEKKCTFEEMCGMHRGKAVGVCFLFAFGKKSFLMLISCETRGSQTLSECYSYTGHYHNWLMIPTSVILAIR